MFSNMDTSNSNDQSQGRSQGQVPPIMLLLQQLLGIQLDQQQTGAGANQDTPSAPHPPSDHQDQAPPPPPSTQQQAPPPPFPSAPGHQQQQTPPPPFQSNPGHQHQQIPPPPQQNQFCSNCSGRQNQ